MECHASSKKEALMKIHLSAICLLAACAADPFDDPGGDDIDSESRELACGDPTPAFVIDMPATGHTAVLDTPVLGQSYGVPCSFYFVFEIDHAANRRYAIDLPNRFLSRDECAASHVALLVEAYHAGVLLDPTGHRIPPGWITLSAQAPYGVWDPARGCQLAAHHEGFPAVAYSKLRVSTGVWSPAGPLPLGITTIGK
jgi:hypothetical protein